MCHITIHFPISIYIDIFHERAVPYIHRRVAPKALLDLTHTIRWAPMRNFFWPSVGSQLARAIELIAKNGFSFLINNSFHPVRVEKCQNRKVIYTGGLLTCISWDFSIEYNIRKNYIEIFNLNLKVPEPPWDNIKPWSHVSILYTLCTYAEPSAFQVGQHTIKN